MTFSNFLGRAGTSNAHQASPKDYIHNSPHRNWNWSHGVSTDQLTPWPLEASASVSKVVALTIFSQGLPVNLENGSSDAENPEKNLAQFTLIRKACRHRCQQLYEKTQKPWTQFTFIQKARRHHCQQLLLRKSVPDPSVR